MARNPTLVEFDGVQPVSFSGGFTAPASADAIVASYPDTVTEVFTYKTGGVSGTTVMTVTVVYTDSTKAEIDTVVKT